MKNSWVFLIFSLLVNVVLMSLMVGGKSWNTERKSAKTEPAGIEYPLLSRRIQSENHGDMLINFMSLRKQLRDYLEQMPNATRMSMYFEYLPSGVSIGLNEQSSYVMASLLKVPLVMAAYHEMEAGRMKADTLLTIREQNIDMAFGDLWRKGVGFQLTVEDAIALTLQQSDNTAKSLIFEATPERSLEEVFDSLDIPKAKESGGGVVISPKNYAAILRSLYISSYLSMNSSEKILELLSRTPFGDKLAAGVPNGVPVAHKIGVYSPNQAENSIYTDCGIVYIPRRTYVLCMMGRTTEDEARVWMREVSKMVYEYVEKSIPNGI